MKARILRQASILFASNLRQSIAYWQDKLGFEQHGIFGEPPELAIMEYGNVFAMLKQARMGTRSFPTGRSVKGCGTHFWVDDVEALFADVKERGATIDYGLCDQFYNVREFAVHDPDRQSIGVGQLLTKASGGLP